MDVEALTAVPPHWGPVRVFLGGPPLWFVLATVFVAMRGWRLRRPARASLMQLVVLPMAVLAWHLRQFAVIEGAMPIMPLVWLVAGAAGFWLGGMLVQTLQLQAGSVRGEFVHGGDPTWLPLAFGFLVFEFLAARVRIWNPALMEDPVLLIGYASVAGLIAGMCFGRLEGLLRRYRRAVQAVPTP